MVFMRWNQHKAHQRSHRPLKESCKKTPEMSNPFSRSRAEEPTFTLSAQNMKAGPQQETTPSCMRVHFTTRTGDSEKTAGRRLSFRYIF